MSDDPERPQHPLVEALRSLGFIDRGSTVAFTKFGPPPPPPTRGYLTTTIAPVDVHPTATTIIGKDGKPQPGKYSIRTQLVTEFDVLDTGEVIVRRSEAIGEDPAGRG